MSDEHSSDLSEYESDEEEDWVEQYHASVYSGFDRKTTEEEYCWNCWNKISETLLQCEHCKLAHYCDRECQKENFSDHESECKSISKSMKIVDDRREDLKYMCCSDCDCCDCDCCDQCCNCDKDAFDIMVGHFWKKDSTRDYLRKRNVFVKHIRNLAYEIETKSLWNAVLKHQLDLLRLCEYDNLGVREGVPSVLLALNRDDDCYKFIRSWMFYEIDLRVAPWEYESTDRYGDPLGDFNFEGWHMCLSHLVALLVVKMRIVATYEAHVKTLQDVLPFDDLARANILSFCDDIKGDFERQKALREKYLHRVYFFYEHFLPGLLHPGPMQVLHYPNSESRAVVEARMHMDNCCRHILRVPGAKDFIRDFLYPKL